MRATPRRKRVRKFIRLSLKMTLLALIIGAICFIDSSAGLSNIYQQNNKNINILYSGIVMATAYNSLEGQTDSTPWITASGTRCREGVIASNFLPFGTKVKIEGFGDQVFVVEDRMNKRYTKRIDIWFRDYNAAMKFGIRKIKFHVIKEA